jgi:alpha-tubulin suppressor-like RCC1 family protein
LGQRGTFSQVSAGYDHTCGLRTDGTVACWGANNSAQSTPPSGTFSQVSAGHFYTCGVKTDGTVAGWGRTTTARPRRREHDDDLPVEGAAPEDLTDEQWASGS